MAYRSDHEAAVARADALARDLAAAEQRAADAERRLAAPPGTAAPGRGDRDAAAIAVLCVVLLAFFVGLTVFAR